MSHAELCPLCHGTGKNDTIPEDVKECHGCEGDGWVNVCDCDGDVKTLTPEDVDGMIKKHFEGILGRGLKFPMGPGPHYVTHEVIIWG